jgi:hypothetical protein
VLLDLLTQLIDVPHPALMVDVSSGTGLSTAIWSFGSEPISWYWSYRVRIAIK